MARLRVGILTGGGDVPGLNACIRSVTLNAIERGWDVVGLRKGWSGVLEIDPDDPASISTHTRKLDAAAVSGIDRLGGTILHTSRLDPGNTSDGDRSDHVLNVLGRLGVDALVTLGGDGTLRFSAQLARRGFPVISIPKTMDNDVFGTDYCIGFSTAVSRSMEAINALRTTIESHERIGVVELFGRRSGETALIAGFLAQVDRSLIAEVPVNLDRLLPLLEQDKLSRAGNCAICVVSEGARIEGEEGESDRADEIGRPATRRTMLGVGHRLARAIEDRSGHGTMVQSLGYLMRAGAPDALDRMVGFAFGGLAVQLIGEGWTDRMVALNRGRYDHVPADTVLQGHKSVDVASLYDPDSFQARLTRIEGMPMFLY